MISVLLSTYNRPQLIVGCIKKILEQSFNDFEIIVLDDCSTDNTKDLILSIQDKRIKYHRNKENCVGKFGHTYVLKQLLNLKKGEQFIILCDDDYWCDADFLLNVNKVFLNDNNISKVIGNQVNYYFKNLNNYEWFTNRQILKFLDTQNKQFYYHGNILPDGFIKNIDYLKYFANDPLKINISCTGTVFNSKIFEKSLSLNTKTFSKWQGGYEMLIPNSILGSGVFFLSNPSLVSGLHKNNMSFQATQKLHYEDILFSISNGFKNINTIKSEIEVSDLIRIKKNFYFNVSKAFLYHSIEILKTNQLSLNSKQNIDSYVTPLDVIKKIRFNFFKLNIFFLSCYLYLLIVKTNCYLLFRKLINKKLWP
jgi:glycosyltransferase involved in cell wall biosynthesis